METLERARASRGSRPQPRRQAAAEAPGLHYGGHAALSLRDRPWAGKGKGKGEGEGKGKGKGKGIHYQYFCLAAAAAAAAATTRAEGGLGAEDVGVWEVSCVYCKRCG